MPKWITPSKSGVHRAACFALYRALLRQQHRLPLNDQLSSVLRRRIRNSFRKDATLQSPPRIIASLRLGYHILETLHKDLSSWPGTLIQSLSSSISTQADPPCARSSNSFIAKQETAWFPRQSKPRIERPRVWAHSNAKSVLDRPFPKLTGRRHVPKLVSANQVPFLRFKKPQSPFLGRIIQDSVKARNGRLDRSRDLEDQISYAEDENEWDRLLWENCDVKMDLWQDKSWGKAIKVAISENVELTYAHSRRRLEIIEKMHEIVNKEKALAEEEQQVMRDEKLKRRKERQLARPAKVEPARLI